MQYHTHKACKDSTKSAFFYLMTSFGFHINDLDASQGYRITLNQHASKSIEKCLLIAMTFAQEIE